MPLPKFYLVVYLFVVTPEDKDCFGKNTEGGMRGDLQKPKAYVICPHYLSPVPQKNTLILCFQALHPSLFPRFSSMVSGIKNMKKILKSTRS